MYADMWGNKTSDSQMSNSFNLDKNNVHEVAKHITSLILMNSLFFNIQIEEEGSQYDVLISAQHYNQGIHQRGIKPYDVLIGVIGFGCYGFRCEEMNNTSVGYYQEKLGIGSELLSTLFNRIRDELGGVVKC